MAALVVGLAVSVLLTSDTDPACAASEPIAGKPHRACVDFEPELARVDALARALDGKARVAAVAANDDDRKLMLDASEALSIDVRLLALSSWSCRRGTLDDDYLAARAKALQGAPR
jgi:hypothetical protein